jgi:hypothetical protein
MAPIWDLCQILWLVSALLLVSVLSADISISIIFPTSELLFLFSFTLLSHDCKRHFECFRRKDLIRINDFVRESDQPMEKKTAQQISLSLAT